MPVQASTGAGQVDWLFDFIMTVTSITTLVVVVLMIYFVAKYRAKSRKEEAPQPSSTHNTALEMVWSIVPLPIAIAMFVWGFQGYMNMRISPRDAYQVHATAQKWKWLFEYENGYTDDALHVPVGKKVRVVISSSDVLHSLYLPAFRQKMDAVPGRYTELWFEATKPGDYPLFCAEYCGTSHSDMITHVVVHAEGGFEAWLAEAEKKLLDLPPVALGQVMFTKQGCATCHTTDGSAKVGPSFKGLFGRQETLADGSSVTVDENYLRESMTDPQAKVVKGFPPVMPTFQGKLDDRSISGIIAFIKAQK